MKPSKRIVKKGKETYIVGANGKLYRVSVYGRHAVWLMFQKEVEDLTDEELSKFQGKYL